MATGAEVPTVPLEVLLSRFRETGDPGAMTALLDATARDLFRLAVRLAPDAASAEDALQETYLALIEAAPRPGAVRLVMPWLVGTLRRKVLRGRRTEARSPDPLRFDPPPVPGNPATEAERAEQIERVRRALEELPEPYRETALLRWRYGLEPAAIAHARGLPPGTVRSHLSRALERLRASLGSIIVWYLDTPVPRGLSSVRGTVLRAARVAAPAATAAAAAGGAAASLLGALLMAKKTLAVASVLVGMLLAGWLASREGPGAPPIRGPEVGSPGVAAVPSAGVARSGAATDGEGAARAAASGVRLGEEIPVDLPPPPFGAVLLRATWPDGTPAAGIRVHLVPRDGPAPLLNGVRVTTGPDGRVRVPRIHGGSVAAYGQRGGGASGEVPPGGSIELELKIPEGMEVRGVVVDRGGAGVAGAEILLDGRPAARSAADGTFLLRHVSHGTDLAARAPGFAPSAEIMVLGSAGATRTVRLVLPGPGGAVAGRVLGPDGDPVAGAVVQVGSEHGRWMLLEDGSSGQAPSAHEVRTDRDGRFRVDGVEPGEVRVAARTPQLPPAEMSVAVEPGAVAAVEVRLDREAVVFGAVRDADGTPVDRAEVLVGRYAGFASFAEFTREDGSFRMEGLPAGIVEFQAVGDGKGRASATLELAPGEEARWDPVLRPGWVIRGRVVRPDGTPLRGWLVEARPVQPGVPWFGNDRTDDEGRFHIEGRPADPVNVAAMAPVEGDWPTSLYPSAIIRGLSPSEAELLIHVPEEADPSAFLTGRVLGPDGAPVAPVHVKVRSTGSPFTPYLFADEETGRFRAGPLPPGAYEVTFEAKGFPEIVAGTVHLSAGETREFPEARFAAGGSLRVEARGADGEAVDRCWGQAIRADGTGASYLVSEGAKARSTSLVPGSYALRVESHGQDGPRVAVITAEIRAGEETRIEAPLLPAVHRTLECRFPEGVTVPDRVRFRIRDSLGRLFHDGDYRPTVTLTLPFGRHAVQVRGPDGLRAEALVDVSATGDGGTTDPIVLDLR